MSRPKQPALFEPEKIAIPPEIQPVLDVWVAYKKRQWRFTYTDDALAILVERMAEMGPERAMAAVKWSMGGSGHPYKGLWEPPASGHKKVEPSRFAKVSPEAARLAEAWANLPEAPPLSLEAFRTIKRQIATAMKSLEREEFDTWFAPLKLLRMAPDHFEVAVPNARWYFTLKESYGWVLVQFNLGLNLPDGSVPE